MFPAAWRALRMFGLYRNIGTALWNRGHGYAESDAEVIYRLRNGVELVAAPGPHDVKIINEIWIDRCYARPGFIPEPGWTVVDLGANKGFFAACALTAAAVTVACVEPDPRNVAALRRNTARWADQVTVHEAAVAGVPGELVLHRLAGRHGQSSLSRARAASRGVIAAEIRVPVVDLASVVAPFDRVDLLKVDIEGGEYAALLDGPPGALDRVERIVAEVDDVDPVDPSRRREHLLGHLRDAGFRLVADRGGLVFFQSRVQTAHG